MVTDKIMIALVWALAHWEIVAPGLYLLLDWIGRKIPTIKRGSLWSSLGKITKAVGSLWFLGPIGKLLDKIGDVFWKIGDGFDKVVKDKRK